MRREEFMILNKQSNLAMCCRRGLGFILAGIVFMTAETVAHAQPSPSSELGDASIGIRAGVLVQGENQPLTAPQGTLLIAPSQPGPPRDRALVLDTLASEKGDPPRRHFQRYEVKVDDRPYQTTQVHPWGLPFYDTALPYAPKSVKVTASLSTGELLSATVVVPEKLPLKRAIDIRAGEIRQTSGRYDEGRQRIKEAVLPAITLVAPYRDQIAYRIDDPNAGGGGH
jgi:hypothetical protein